MNARNGSAAERIRSYAPLALISFLSLYLELVVIRWLASEVRIFAYFKNFPLMAAFLGAGIGCLLAQRRRDYFRHAPLLLLVLSAVISFAYRGGYTFITFVDPFEHYLIGGSFNFDNPLFQMLKGAAFVLGIFALVAALFAAIGSKLGACLNEQEALPGYSVNVAFSLAGIVLYAVLCRFGSGPAAWIFIAGLSLLPFFWKSWHMIAVAAAIVLPAALTPSSVIWTPYYRVDVQPISLPDNKGNWYDAGHNVFVNHDGIFGTYNYSDEFVAKLPAETKDRLLDYYNVSYRIFGQRFQRIAILGSGGGNDIAAALRQGVQSIDAVEIDPGIVDVGRKYHPEHPYASEKVRVHVGDARTFVRDSRNSGYDMIVFGALDSHAVFSSMSSVRLDNYVYTVESFQEALRRLKPDGILAITFYFVKDWQLHRVFDALWRANGEKPVAVHSLGSQRNNLVLLAGPGANRAKLMQHPYVIEQNAEKLVGDGAVEPTTDDWPFLYLRERGFPLNYGYILMLLFGFSYIAATRAAQVSSSRFDWVMFLMGAGFMLIETKILAKTALLAGATWVVNTFVISAVLIMILFANLVVTKGWLRDIRLCLSGLFLSILVDWLFRFNTITFVSWPALNLSIVLALMAMPLFFAGILFANFYKNAESPGVALGYNLFGAMAGGILEYASMAWGVNSLNLISLAAYGGVAVMWIAGRARLSGRPVAQELFGSSVVD
jgi:SAM-dependent methyltransferase